MRLSCLILIFIVSKIGVCQDAKTLRTDRITEEITVDGVLNESVWRTAEVASEFIQFGPNAGAPATEKTEVKVLHDDNALYIGAVIHFNDRDSIFDNLAERDNAEEADWFAITLDPYKSGLNGFVFQISASGVQTDILIIGEDEDYQWNAVWRSEVVINEYDWTLEVRIPYSAIRFPKKEVQKWGINFGRLIYGKRELSFWNETDPNGPALINYLGNLNGIQNIKSPVRLSVSPYVSGYVENFDGNTSYRAAGGADLRYGINDAFTVDMTLVPDFGQVRFDNQIYNLTPFEVQFNENRQFFKEGRDLFDKGEIFYSRRIGAEPAFMEDVYDELDDGESIESNPGISQLINASKISGRTKSGLGIGVFNGITREMHAVIVDSLGNKRKVVTDPFTNYNVFALDQNLKNNSSVSLVNTNVMRNGAYYDANVTALVFDIFTKEQQFNYYGNANLSRQKSNYINELGHQYSFGVEKSSGKLQYGIEYFEMSDSYDINDLGFQTNNNERSVYTQIGYRSYVPKGRTVSRWLGAEFEYTMLYNPSVYTAFQINSNAGVTWRNFLSTAIWTSVLPTAQNDYFEPRMPGRYYQRPAGEFINCLISSNFNKPFALEFVGNFTNRHKNGWKAYSGTLTPRFRIGSKWMIIIDASLSQETNNEGVALAGELPLDGNNPIFGQRDIRTVENRLNIRHFFTNKMTLSFSGRHYWANIKYTNFLGLNTNGTLYDINYSGLDFEGNSLHNTNFNAFTIDMVYSWFFAPGSTMSIVWKNSIFNQNDKIDLNYFNNSEELFSLSATNSFSIKVLYYLDYWMIKEKLGKK